MGCELLRGSRLGVLTQHLRHSPLLLQLLLSKLFKCCVARVYLFIIESRHTSWTPIKHLVCNGVGFTIFLQMRRPLWQLLLLRSLLLRSLLLRLLLLRLLLLRLPLLRLLLLRLLAVCATGAMPFLGPNALLVSSTPCCSLG